MKRTVKVTRYIIICLAAAVVGLVVTRAVIADAETDRQLAEVDRFIETHQAARSSTIPVSGIVALAAEHENVTHAEAETENREIVKKTQSDTFSDEKMTVSAENGTVSLKPENAINVFDSPETGGFLQDTTTDGFNGEASDGFTDSDSGIAGSWDDNGSDMYSGGTDTYLEGEPEMTPEEFQTAGVIDWNGWRFTYYSEQVLPGGGLDIPGRWSDGTFVRDGSGFLCVASNVNDLPFGTVVETPFGTGIVYDCGCDPGIIDIYVSW